MNEIPTVLVIDDDIMLLKTIEEILSSDYQVSLSRTSAQAMRLLANGFLPEIVLLDIDMPEMNGYETIKELKQIKNMSDVPVVFLTGMTESESEIKGLELGAIDYIKKPFVKEILLLRIKTHIESGKQNRKLSQFKKNKLEILVDEEKFSELPEKLTNTEKKIAKLIAMGYTNQEIGEELGYSYSYVKKVTTVIFEKVGINKRHELRRFLI